MLLMMMVLVIMLMMMMISDHLPSSVQYFVATLSSENFSCGKAENGPHY